MKRLVPWLFAVALAGCGGGGGIFTDLPEDPVPVGDNYADRLDLTYWPARPVRVSFDTSGTYTTARRDTALAAFRKWERPTGGVVDFVVVQPSDSPDIVVRFRPQADPEVANVAGVTTLKIRGEAIQDVIVDIGTNLDADDFQKTCTHEWGHAFGLTGGHSDQRSDIMYAFLSDATEVSERDANTMILAYRNRGRSVPDAPLKTYRISFGSSGCEYILIHSDEHE